MNSPSGGHPSAIKLTEQVKTTRIDGGYEDGIKALVDIVAKITTSRNDNQALPGIYYYPLALAFLRAGIICARANEWSNAQQNLSDGYGYAKRIVNDGQTFCHLRGTLALNLAISSIRTATRRSRSNKFEDWANQALGHFQASRHRPSPEVTEAYTTCMLAIMQWQAGQLTADQTLSELTPRRTAPLAVQSNWAGRIHGIIGAIQNGSQTIPDPLRVGALDLIII